VAKEVIPHEAAVRAWLLRSRVSHEDVDELIQESYSRLAALDSVEHIARADAYFFSIARNLLVRRLKRARIVAIDTIAEIDAYVEDLKPSPEREAAGRLDYQRLLGMIAVLPDRCRRMVEMRKIEGLSQREIATALGVTESVVENQVHFGVKAVLRAWRIEEDAAAVRLGLAPEGEHRA
jgi:RNA polymerase sigma factor (sigma-70 family)